MTNLAEILKQIRLDSGTSQAEFAKKIGVSQRTWSSYESGETRPKMATMLALASMGYKIPDFAIGAYQGMKSVGSAGAVLRQLEKQNTKTMTAAPSQTFDVFRLKHGSMIPLDAKETDFDALVLLPVFTQTAAAGRGQPETQLQEVDKYIPIVLEMLGGANPKNCGIVRVVGDSMTDMNLFNGDFAVFDRTQIDGDGVYVISIGADVRVKHLEYRPLERKIVISSENAKRYPNPEIISYEQAENMLRIHGKVISWLHRNPY